jgi:hypothetical protein
MKRIKGQKTLEIAVDCPKCKGSGIFTCSGATGTHSYPCVLCFGDKKMLLVVLHYHYRRLKETV